MAYSRWSDSKWYTFWYSSKAIKKNEEVLAIYLVDFDTMFYFKYGELRDIENICQSIKNKRFRF